MTTHAESINSDLQRGLITDKTKCMIFGSLPQLRKLEYSTFNAGGEIVELASSARNLRIILDSTFSMTDHIT